MACPFFFPAEKSQTVAWAFPSRLPLGSGFCGSCRANGQESTPSDGEIRDFCNLGYAAGCSRFPEERRADCLRFVVADDDASAGRIVLAYIYEREHTPVEHGRLEYDCASQSWLAMLSDACGQRQAECFLSVYLERRRK